VRLIDADALLENQPKGCYRTSDWINAAPTIDAIPMWWITEKFLDVLNKDKELSKAVWLVRNAWQKEQEASE
jgi:hypothetical protein